MPNPFDRRSFLTRTLSTGTALALTLESKAEPDSPAEDPGHWGLVTPEVQRAVERGLAFLATTQNRDGSFGNNAYAGNVAVTALGGLALLAGGHHPGRGAFGQSIARAVQYVLTQEQRTPRGFLYANGGMREGPMYSHGFGLLFLAETFGTIGDARLQTQLRGTIERAIQVVLNSQNSEGGWRYEPVRQIADVSVTICQIMALRACRNAGFYVPKSNVDACVKYIRGCQLADGGFSYFANQGKSDFPRSAAGVVALYCAGIYEGEEIRRGLNYLANFRPGSNFPRAFQQDKWYYYGQYYGAQAMWTAGGRYWSDWFPAIRDELLTKSRQRGDGIWNDGAVGSHYSTAMACIILQIPNNYLPILQK